MKEMFTSYRFWVYVSSLVFVFGYMLMCRKAPDLIQIQGVVLGVVGIATALVVGRTVTDWADSKKPEEPPK